MRLIPAKGSKSKQRTFKVDPERELHVKTEDGDKFACKICDKKYGKLKVLRNHILRKHKEAYKCPICSMQCIGRFHYIRHSKTHDSDAKCNLRKISMTKESSSNHHLDTRAKRFQCEICHKTFIHKASLTKHMLWHIGKNKKFMCDICGHGFNDKTNLNSHIRAVHEKLRPFKCPLCPKTFKANKNLKEHSFYHTGEKPYQCKTCNDAFMSSWRLRHHRPICSQNSIAGQERKLYTCKICNLGLDSRGTFMIHLRKHTGQKEFKCHLCPKDFTSKYALNRHIIAHSGVKPYACDMCDLKYTQPSVLWRHKKLIHDPNSPSYAGRIVELVKCDLCNKSFKNLQKHMVSHKLRPHVCEICSKSYPERNTLNRHILIVHQGVKQHPCTRCPKKYTKVEGLRKHTRKVHKLELKKEVEES